MITQDDLDALDAHIATKYGSSASPSGESSLLARSGQHLANLPSNILESLVHSGEAIGNLGAIDPDEPWKAPKPFTVAPPTTTGEMITDVIGGHLVPELAAAVAPFGLAAKATRLAGGSALAADVAGNVAAGAFTGIKESPEAAFQYGATGGALAGLGPLSLAQKAIPIAGVAGADAAWTYASTGSPEAALAAGGLDVGLGLLPNVLNRFKSGAIVADEIIPPRDRRAPRLETPEIGPTVYPGAYTERLGLPPPSEHPLRSYQGYEGSDAPIIIPSPYGGELPPYVHPSRTLATLPPGVDPIIPEGPWWRNSFRGNEEADIHIGDSYYPLADIIDPTFQPKPEVDELFRLKDPIIGPQDVQAYQPGQQLVVQPSVGQKRPQLVRISPEEAKELGTRLDNKLFELEADMKFAHEEGDQATVDSLRRVIAKLRSNRHNIGESGFIDASILNYIGQPILGAFIGGAQGDTPQERVVGAAAGAAAGLGLAHLTNGGLNLNRFKQQGNPFDDVIESGRVVYDGENDIMGRKLHQFTIEDPSLKAHGFTFQVKGEVTPDSFADAYNNARIRAGDEPLARPMERKPRATETGAINLGQPFRTAFEDKATVSPEGIVTHVGKDSVSKTGLMNLNRFKKSSQITDDELKAYQLAYPQAFIGDEINVNQLKTLMEQQKLLQITDISHGEGQASQYDRAKAKLQHLIDSQTGPERDRYYVEWNDDLQEPPVLGIGDRDDPEGIAWFSEIRGSEANQVPANIREAWNEMYAIGRHTPAERSASVRYESYELNPRPIAELQAKGGMDQLVQVPIGEDRLPIEQNVLHESNHFNAPDSANILNFTRGYVDEIPGKGKAEIIYESQGDWAQERRKWLRDNPKIESVDKIPESARWIGPNEYPNSPWELRVGNKTAEGKTQEEAVRNYNEWRENAAPKDHPFLNQYKRLGLKARVQKALNEGQEGIFLHDARTVTMTEGHDKVREAIQDWSIKEIRTEYRSHFDPRDTKQATIHLKKDFGEDWAKGRYVKWNSRIYRVDKPEANRKEAIEIARELVPYQAGQYHIPQLKGMEKNYDQDYVNILTELTGSKPEKLTMGQQTHRAYETVKPWRVVYDPGYGVDRIDSFNTEAEVNAFAKQINDQGLKIKEGPYKVPDIGSKALGNKSDISGWWFDLKPLREKVKKSGDPRLSLSGRSGFISTHLATTALGAGIGAEEGYRQSGGDPQSALAGAVMGGTAGFLGYKMLEALTRPNPNLRPTGKVGADLNRFKKETKEGIKEAMAKPARDIAGENVFGRGGVMSKFIKGMEFWTRLHLPEEIKTAWTQARGTGVLAVQSVVNALDKIKGFEVDPAIRDAASKFLDGKFLPEADAIRVILAGGGVTEDVWKALDKKSRPSNFTRWEVGDGPTAKRFYIPEQIKTRLMVAEENAFKATLGSANARYFDFVRTGRRSLDQLQSLFAEALPEGGDLNRIIRDSIGQYVTRTYRIFTDKAYRPTESQIRAAMDELGAHMTKKGQEFTDDYLRREIENYLHEIQTSKQLFGIGQGRKTLDSTLLQEREDISPTFRELLGEYRDPKDRILQAIGRIYPSAQAAKFISLAADMKLDGLKASMKRDEWVTESQKINQELNRLKSIGASEDVIAAVEAKRRRLNEYVELPNSIKFGEFKGVLANRFVADQLRGFDGHLGGWDTPIFRSFAAVNNWSKIIHTAYSPATIARNYVTMPLMMALGKASPEAGMQAWKAVKAKSGPLYNELIENGILTADQVSGEFRTRFEDVFNGHYDSSLVSKARGANESILEFYRFPDLIVRASTYIEAKSRFSAQMKLPIDDPRVIEKAVRWTDRRTMNYDNIAPAIRLGRNLPFFNQFISYSAEITRITKNLAMDAVGLGWDNKPDFQALFLLGMLAGAPAALQAGAEAGLSKTDREAWEKANALSPDYSRTRFKLPLYRDAKGNFHYADITPYIPTDNINQMIRAGLAGDTKALMAVNPVIGWQETPVIKMLAQGVSGRDLITQRTFRGPVDYIGMVAKELSPSWTPGIGYEWNKAASIGTENVKTGRAESWTGVLARNLVGLNLTSVNPSTLEKSAMARVKQEIANERAYLNDVLKMKGVDAGKKQRAVTRYQESVAAILTDYAVKVKQSGSPTQAQVPVRP